MNDLQISEQEKNFAERCAQKYRCVSFFVCEGIVSLLVSAPLVGESLEWGSKTVGCSMEPGDRFLGISYLQFLAADRGTIAFDPSGTPYPRAFAVRTGEKGLMSGVRGHAYKAER
jgi:hypothetical protein